MSREKINILYYPDMLVSESTLKKAILLFDELHFIDRPSFTFDNFGLIGEPSPLREFEESFREAGVPFYVHSVQGGKIQGDFLERICADIQDPRFIKKFKEGLENSLTFREHHVPAGNYGVIDTEKDVIEKISKLNFTEVFTNFDVINDLLKNNEIHPCDLSSQQGCAKRLIALAALCSAKINFALLEGVKHGFSPLADATPYSDLLEARYLRAMNNLEPKKHKIQITDLSFAIFDELITTKCVERLNMQQIVQYRKSSMKAREEFLEYLSMLQIKQAGISLEGDYCDIITKLVKTEIIPAARNFRHKLHAIDDTFFGSLAKGALGAIGGSYGISIFGDLSFDKILLLSGATGTYILKAAIDRFVSQRASQRECSISYLLSLDN